MSGVQPQQAVAPSPNPLPSNDTGGLAADGAIAQRPVSPWDRLPPGWETVTSPSDGRIYYWERSTGLTSWAHPMANLAMVAQATRDATAAQVNVDNSEAPNSAPKDAAASTHEARYPSHPQPPPPPPPPPAHHHPMAAVPAVIATPGAGYPYEESPAAPSTPPPSQLHQHQQHQGFGSKEEALLPPEVPRTMRSGGRNNGNPFHGWGQFFSGGYQSAIPSSPSTASSNGSYCGYGPSSGGRGYPVSNWYDTPQNATHRPSSHQCHAMAAFILFPPLGVCAFINSFQVDRAWGQGMYGDAYNYSKQAKSYATFSCWIGVILWTYVLVIQPNENFNFGQWWQQSFGN